jgi:hypothetical protein
MRRQKRTQFDSDHVHRSWRTIEAVEINANATVGEMRRKRLTVGFTDLDGNNRRKNAGEKGMQRAAVVGAVRALIAVMVRGFAVVMMRVAVGVEAGGSGEGFSARQR